MPSFYENYGKAFFDRMASTIGLIVLSPLLLSVAILVKMTSKGPVFYSQERMGREFKPFQMLKFRSMIVAQEKNSRLVTASNDRRITGVGKWLRRLKLDELPQLINVIKGDMALVGPRPEVNRYIQHYKSDYETILSIRPGITDYASIEYKNEEVLLSKADDVEKAYIQEVLPEKIKLYKYYAENITFFGDIKLILKTIF